MVVHPSTKEEELMLWKEFMELWRDHPLWVLNNVEKMQEFKVSWNNYSRIRVLCEHCLKFNYLGVKKCRYCGKELKNHKTHTFGVGLPPKMLKNTPKIETFINK
jgi:hypothetical protein